MVKAKSEYVCESCGAHAVRWSGRCSTCGEWDSLHEEIAAPAVPAAPSRASLSHAPKPIALPEITAQDTPRIATGIAELDRVLGGGLVPGAAVLIAGEPGIGKSTILLQAGGRLAAAGRRVLYVSGEESAAQIGLRARRLGIDAGELFVLPDTDLRRILAVAAEHAPAVLVLDSIQMVHDPELSATPGSVRQVRECAAALVLHAKRHGIPLILVGHVTKDGAIAGPKTLEHLVDTVLALEGDRSYGHRLLRTSKNRFGRTEEIGLFEMADEGLREVADPTALFLNTERDEAPGSIVFPWVEGSRVLLVEVQALAATSGGGSPARRVSGVDPNRLALVLAVLERAAGLSFASLEVFVNVVGGVKLAEPAADLAIALALASAHTGRPLPRDAVAFGELGLQGEVRGVSRAAARLGEAARLGFPTAVAPADAGRVGGRRVHAIRRLRDAVERILG